MGITPDNVSGTPPVVPDKKSWLTPEVIKGWKAVTGVAIAVVAWYAKTKWGLPPEIADAGITGGLVLTGAGVYGKLIKAGIVPPPTPPKEGV